MCFTILSKEKMPFESRRSPKSPKIGNFAKGLVLGFSQNLDLCVTLFWGQKRPAEKRLSRR